MKGFQPPASNDSPDLTPMIDVVFLLIVFFMVVAQRMSEQYIELSALAVAGIQRLRKALLQELLSLLMKLPRGKKFIGVKH